MSGQHFDIEPTPTAQTPKITVPPPPPITLPPPPPEAPEKPADTIGPHASGALGELGGIARVLLILALISVGAAMNDFFNWLFRAQLGNLLRGRKPTPTTALKLTQTLSNTLGSAYGGVDQDIGQSFTKLATLHARSHRLAVKKAAVANQLAQRVARLEINTNRVNKAQLATQNRAAAAGALATHAEQKAAVLGHKLDAGEQGASARITALEHHITHLIEPELETLRSAKKELEKGAIVTWDQIVKHESLLGEAAVTAAVAGGISRIGADWIKCEASKLLGKSICRQGPSFWKDLLGLTLAGMAIGDACAIVKAVITGVEDAAPVLDLIATGAEDLLKCLAVEQPPPMPCTQYGFATGQKYAAYAVA